MSGGANNGAWETGIIWGLANYGNPADFEWLVSTGVSAGSINTAYLAAWAPNDLLNMAAAFSEMWTTTKTDDIWTQWPGGLA
jgi:predicted acylesterase/phospholipase RssA